MHGYANLAGTDALTQSAACRYAIFHGVGLKHIVAGLQGGSRCVQEIALDVAAEILRDRPFQDRKQSRIKIDQFGAVTRTLALYLCHLLGRCGQAVVTACFEPGTVGEHELSGGRLASKYHSRFAVPFYRGGSGIFCGMLQDVYGLPHTGCATPEHKIFQVFDALGTSAHSGLGSFCDDFVFDQGCHALIHDAISQSGQPIAVRHIHSFINGCAGLCHVVAEVGQFPITIRIGFESRQN